MQRNQNVKAYISLFVNSNNVMGPTIKDILMKQIDHGDAVYVFNLGADHLIHGGGGYGFSSGSNFYLATLFIFALGFRPTLLGYARSLFSYWLSIT